MTETGIPIVTTGAAKGGVGKSTLTANVAACLARAGLRPLVLDLDPQGSVTRFLANTYREKTMTRLASLNSREKIKQEIDGLCSFAMPKEHSIVRFFDGQGVVPQVFHGVALVGFSHESTSRLSELNNQTTQAKFLDAMSKTVADYKPDVIFIDTPPSNLDAAAFAISQSTHLLIPLEPTEEGIRGAIIADEQRQAAIRIAKARGWDLDIALAGVVPMAVLRCNVSTHAIKIAKVIFNDRVTSPIDHAVTIKEANTEGLPVIIYEEKIRGLAKTYQLGSHKYHKSGRQIMQVSLEIGVNLGLLKEAPPPLQEDDQSSSTGNVASAEGAK